MKYRLMTAALLLAFYPAPSEARGTAGIINPLASKVEEIRAGCGSTIVSAVRHTRIAGTRRMSLHASGRAVDMSGNPGCIYAHLRSWPGGYSTDYGRMRHVHISYGGYEMGLRFRHGGGGYRHHRHRYHRYARYHHRHHHYASAR